MIEIEWGCKSSFLEFVFFFGFKFECRKIEKLSNFIIFCQTVCNKEQTTKKKKQLDIKLDNSTSSFIPKIYGKNKREKECSDWKTIHNYFFSFS